jgi:hypothetical protein
MLLDHVPRQFGVGERFVFGVDCRARWRIACRRCRAIRRSARRLSLKSQRAPPPQSNDGKLIEVAEAVVESHTLLVLVQPDPAN